MSTVQLSRNDDSSVVLCGQFKYSIGILGSALATIIPSETIKGVLLVFRIWKPLRQVEFISRAVRSITADCLRFQHGPFSIQRMLKIA